jgi:Dolichyl-phosphate-mannose-protein mannosyltransferase
MWAVTQLTQLPSTVPPHLVTAAVLILSATATLVIGLRRCGRGFVRRLPSVLFIWSGAAAFLTLPLEPPWSRTAAIAAAGALLVETVLAYREGVGPTDRAGGSVRLARRYVLATLLVVAVLLFYHLGTYAGALLNWEAPVVAGYPDVGGFAAAYRSGQSVLEYSAQRFLWDQGLLSAGHTSLFYGAPTYALFHLIGFSAWSLRLAAVLATLLSVALLYALTGRFFGPIAGAAAAVAFGLNACVLFYGRYGSSPAGTLLAVLLAVWCTWRLLDSRRPAWWAGPACAASLYAATLQYSPGRIVVLVLLGFLTVVLVWRWRRLHWQQAVGFAVIMVAAAGVWRMQSAYGTQQTFLMARGEQYFDMVRDPESIPELFHQDLLGRPLTSETITLADKIELLYRVMRTTLAQYVDLMSPRIDSDPLTDIPNRGRLPQLYYAPLVLFIAWGVTHSLLRLRAWPHACLVVWVVAATVPLLLTNRVDTHRLLLFVIPLSLWGAFGVWEAARVLAHARVPPDIQHFFAALVALTIVYNDVHLLHREPPPNAAAKTVAAEVAAVPGRVAVGVLLGHRETAWLELALLERSRDDDTQAGKLLDERMVRDARDHSALADDSVRRLQALLKGTTVILAPADSFREVAAALRDRGVQVVEHGRVLRLSNQ